MHCRSMSEAPLKSRILRESRAVLTYPNGAEGVESDDGYCEMASSVRSAGRARTGEAGLKTRGHERRIASVFCRPTASVASASGR